MIQELSIEIIEEGQGQNAKSGDTVIVHYTGTFEDGAVFDSSLTRGEPFSFILGAGMVIRGWEVGIEGMKIGEKRILAIPYHLAYGEYGFGPIPPKATLVFHVELMGIE